MANFGNALTGGLGGAAQGAMLGSFFPGIGTAAGALGGGALGLLGGLGSNNNGSNNRSGNVLTGYQSSNQLVPLRSSGQINLMDQLAKLGLSGVQQNQNGFAPIAQQARSSFAQNTIPSIAERFSALGAQGSSAFGQQLGAAGAGLEEGLAGLGSQYNLGQQQLFQNLLNLGLGQQYGNQYHEAEPGIAHQVINNLPALAYLYMLGKQGAR